MREFRQNPNAKPVQKSRWMSHQAGASLVEVLLTAALISVAVLSSMTFSSVIANSYANSKAILDFENVTAQVNSFISNEQSCRLAFGGPDPGPLAGAAAQQINLSGPREIRLYMPKAAGAGPEGRLVYMDATDANTNKFGDWTLRSLTITPLSMNNAVPVPAAAGPARVSMNVRIVMERNLDLAVPTKRISTTTNLTAYTDAANNIISCTGLSFGTGVDAFAAPVCRPNEALYSDGTHLGCRRIKCVAPYPTPLGGWDAHGNIRCGP